MWKDETSGAPASIWLPLAALLIATAPAQAVDINWSGTGWVEGPKVRHDTPQDPVWVPPSFCLKYPFLHDRGCFSDDKFGHMIGGAISATVVIQITRAVGLDWNPLAVGFATGLIVGYAKEEFDRWAFPKIRHARQTKARAERADAKGREPKPVQYSTGEGEVLDVVATAIGGALAGMVFTIEINKNEHATALKYDQLAYPAPLVGLFPAGGS